MATFQFLKYSKFVATFACRAQFSVSKLSVFKCVLSLVPCCVSIFVYLVCEISLCASLASRVEFICSIIQLKISLTT